jgi:uncharacterized protein YbjT (DUF2867 family)
MKISIIGATGLIGSKVVDLLEGDGHDVVAAARSTGADVLTGEGLGETLSGADVLVDLTNAPSFDDDPVMGFFTRSSANLVAAAKEARVGHYVALSIVGVDGLPESGYMRAKVVQEKTITGSGLSYTIVRATQFQEFAADEVAAEVARAAVGPPINGVVNIGGPDQISFSELARSVLAKQGVDKTVVVDPQAGYFGTTLAQNSLVTAGGAVLGNVHFADWLSTH